MTWVKLCGMTRREDVLTARACGADAVGFVVAPTSPRRVDPARIAALGTGLTIERFLVTVGMDPGELVRLATATGVTGVQPHGDQAREAAMAARQAGFAVLFPTPVEAGPPDLGSVPAGCRPLLDTGGTGVAGGSGRSFAWEHASGLDREFVVAGGLTPATVAEAVRATGAWGVDVASGVEVEPGIKDHELMRRFVEAVR